MVILVLSLLALAMLPMARPAEAATLPLYASVAGPTQAAVNEKHAYTITVIGGHGADPDGNYSYSAQILPYSSDASVSPINGANVSGVFVITLTMPSPIVISADVVNQGSVPLTNVPIVFYLDGSKIYNTTFDLEAGATMTVVFNMTSSVSAGEHTVRVELDPSNQFARFSGGGTVFTTTVYVNPPDYGSTDGMLILLFVMLIIVTYLVYKRPKRRRRSS
jgi:hypothetical protein